MNKKWMELMYDGILLGYVKFGTKISEVSVALKEANLKFKEVKEVKAPVAKTTPVAQKVTPTAKKALKK